MKKAKKRITIGILIAAFLFVAGYSFLYFFINEKAKDVIIRTLKSKYGIDARLYGCNMTFPFRISLIDLESKEFGFMKATADIGRLNIFSGIVIDKLYLKGFYAIIDRDKIAPVAAQINPKKNLASVAVSRQGLLPNLGVTIKEIVFDYGFLAFVDTSMNPPLEIRVDDLYGVIHDFKYPGFSKFSIAQLDGSVVVNGKKMEKALELQGWIDWSKKNMDVLLKLKELDYLALKDYCPSFWKPDHLDIAEAYLSLNSHLVSEKDKLTAENYIILNEIVFKTPPVNESRVKSMKTVIAFFEQNGVPVAHFTHTTKMSAPRFDINSLGDILLQQLRQKGAVGIFDLVNQLLGTTDQVVKGSVQGIKNIAIDPIKQGIEGFGEELLKGIRKVIGIEDNPEAKGDN